MPPMHEVGSGATVMAWLITPLLLDTAWAVAPVTSGTAVGLHDFSPATPCGATMLQVRRF